MCEKLKQQNIQRLDINDNTIEKLKQSKIINIGQLCKKSKTDLKKMNLLQNEISKIEIELQLLGLNLKNGI